MKFAETNRDGVSILALEGMIDVQHSSRLKQQLDEMIDNGHSKILLNFELVDYIDSSGIGCLVAAVSRMRDKQNSLKVTNPSKTVKRTFQLTGLGRLLGLFDSEEEAIPAMLATE